MGAARKALAGTDFEAKHPRGAGGKFVKKGGAAALLQAPTQTAAAPAKTPGKARDILKGSRSKGLTPEIEAEIDAMRGDPQTGDRERMAAALSGLTVAQLTALAKDRGANAFGANKQAKVSNLVEGWVGYKLNSMSIREGTWSDMASVEAMRAQAKAQPGRPVNLAKPSPPAAPAPQADALTRRIKQIDQAMDEVDGRSARQLNDTRKQLVEQRAALGPTQPVPAPAKAPRKARDIMKGGKVSNIPTAAEAATIIANPKPEDRDRLKAHFGAMTVPQIRAEAKARGAFLGGGGGKEQFVGRLVEHEIGHRLNSEAIQRGGWQTDDAWTRGMTPEPKPSATSSASRRHTRDLPDELVYDIERDMRAGHLAALKGRRATDAEWTNIVEWRGPLDAKYGRANVDKVFLDLASGAGPDRGFFAIPESNQKTLTPEKRAAAVAVNGGNANRDRGGQDFHLLSLRMSQNPAEPKLVPLRPATTTPAVQPTQAPASAAQQWSEVLRQLRKATADDEQKVRGLLGTLSKDDLHEIAGELETATKPKKSASKAAHIDALVFGSVGFKERAAAQGSPFAGAASTRNFTVASSSDQLSGVFGGSRRTNPAPRDTFLSGGGEADTASSLAPFKHAKKAEPIESEWTTMPVTQLAAVLANVTADDEGRVRGALQGRNKSELAKIVKAVPTAMAPSSGSTAQQFIDAIVEGTVGFRARARAMGGWKPPAQTPKRARQLLTPRPN